MKENKYYTPTLEEFYTGFEYEIMVPEKGLWSKEIFYLNKSHIDLIKYVNIQDEFTKNKIRVKYLGKEDIEECGFKVGEWFINQGKYSGTYRIQLTSFGVNPRITIDTKDFVRDGSGNYEILNIINRLKIKNKSEFKKLLQQLDIEKIR